MSVARERRLRTVHTDVLGGITVSFHNFKSQNFKLSVSNPKSKYVPYLYVLSQMLNCQGLGRKNKHDILKTDRNYLSSATCLIQYWEAQRGLAKFPSDSKHRCLVQLITP